MSDAISATPHPAATVLLLRDGVDGLEVLMVVRHHQIEFASGALVFPGGRVDRGDRVAAGQRDRCAGPAGLAPELLALRVAGIREGFEECGVLMARRRGRTGLLDAEQLREIEAKHRQALWRRQLHIAAMLAAEDLVLATDLLTPFAHWITPPGVPKRFDTHFFLVPAPADHVAAHDGAESVDSVWIAPARAVAEAIEGRWKILFPTRLNLQKLSRWSTAAAAIEAARHARIVTVLPRVTRTARGRTMHIPAAADYGGDRFEATEPAAM